MALTCVFACLGVGTVLISNKATEAKAATTTHNLGALTFHANSQPWGAAGTWNYRLYLVSENGVGLPVNSWNDAFTADEDGYFKINGEKKTPSDVKSADGCFFFAFDALNAGDVVTIGGSFKCESQGVIYNISESKFQWNGGSWQKYVPVEQYTNHDLGQVVTISGDAEAVYLAFAEGVTLPVSSWDIAFNEITGTGIRVDGVMVRVANNIKSVGNKIYVELANVSEGSLLVVEGGFGNISQGHRYVVEKSMFQWNGTAWVEYVDYKTYTVTKISGYSPKDGQGNVVSNNLYLYTSEGDTLPKEEGDWDARYTFVEGSGDGLSLGGVTFTTTDIKLPGDFFINLGEAPNVGDVFTIDGTYVNEAKAHKFVFVNCQLQWNGTTWVEYVPPVEYAIHELGALTLHVNSTVGGAKDLSSAVYLARADKGTFPILSWDKFFVAENANNFKVNGVAHSLVKVVSTTDGFYWEFGEALKAGDYITISGTFVYETDHVKYVIEESSFIWTGTAWQEYVHIEYTTYQITSLAGTADPLYWYTPNKELPKDVGSYTSDWDNRYTLVEGEITLNGSAITLKEIKLPGDLYVVTGFEPKVNDVLVLNGAIANETTAIKLVFNNCQMKWNGTTWETVATVTPDPEPDPEPEEYTVHNIGALDFHSNVNAGGNGIIYLKRADNKALPVLDWHALFLAESAENFKINGTAHTPSEIKSTGDGFFWKFGKTLNAGDYITISGTFVCETKHVKYVITESKFVWNGSAWEKYVDYTVYNTGSVYISGVSANSVDVAMVGGKYEITDGTWAEKLTFLAGSGVGVTINGNQVGMNDIKIPNDIYIGSLPAAKVGDILAIEGTFYNVNLAVKYVIEYHEFIYNGVTWVYYVDEELLAAYDLVTPINLGLPASLALNGTYDGAGLSYEASSANTTGSVKFRFGYRTTDIATEDIGIRLRGSHWDGVHFLITWSKIGLTGNINYDLASNTDYVIELAAIDFADGSGTWIYVSVNGSLVYSAKHEVSTFNTSHLSFYAANSNSVISDVTRVTVSYETENGTVTEYVEKDAMYTLPEGKTANTFAGWLVNGEFYFAGEEIEIGNESLVLTPVELDFTMDEGAAIRITNTADNSGIRFTSRINVTALESLEEYGATVTYGTLIMPYDYLEGKYEPNMEKFVAGTTVGAQVLKIPSENHEIKDGYVVFRGAMVEINSGNYDRLFAGRGYIEITIGERKVVLYTPFSYEDNVRSIRYVAQQFKDDLAAEFNYAGLSNEKKAIVDAYAQTGTIKLLDYEAYAMDFLNVTAWYHPELDPSNAYNNTTNIEIAQEMKDAGIKTVILDGAHHIDMTTPENITKTRQMINFFGSQGLKTIVFGSNSSDGFNIKWNEKGYPDFSDCKGFIGFLVWDEPKSESFDELAVLAQEFEKTYAGTGVTYMVNLLPSYASIFNTGSTGWFDATIDQLKKGDYQAYLKSYCDTVLSQVSGEKWLSMDSYPINADKTLSSYFLFDLAMLKYYAEYAGATSHAVLQSSGWIEDGYEGKNRMPTQAEMEMQAYAAMAFGIDSISWWSYSDKREDNQQNPTDVADDGTRPYMQRFAAVNAELNAISAVYSAFDWKGVILGAGKDNGGWFDTDDDYEAFKVVKGQIGDYELTESDTKHLASVSRSNTNWNYLMGVMEDMSGNEGYVLCNYNNHKDCGEQTITITFSSNITEVVIYRDGVKSAPIAVNNKTLDVKLAIGEGVIILPSKLG